MISDRPPSKTLLRFSLPYSSADPTNQVSRCQCSIRYLVREARICTLHDVRLACFYTEVSMLTRYSIPAVSLFPLATPDFRKVLAWYKHLTKRLPIPPLSH